MSRVQTDLSLQDEMHRLKVMHRSWIRSAVGASNSEDFKASARIVRRWMRPVRRQLRKSA